jgi:hypothetical protein
MVRDEPLICHCPNLESKKVEATNDNPVQSNVRFVFRNDRNEESGDGLTQGLWACVADCIVDVRVSPMLAPSQTAPTKHRTKKRQQPMNARTRRNRTSCLASRATCFPFVTSADGLLGKLLDKLSALLPENTLFPRSLWMWQCSCVNACVRIAIVRATHLRLHGSRILTSKMSCCLLQWEDKAGLGLFGGH